MRSSTCTSGQENSAFWREREIAQVLKVGAAELSVVGIGKFAGVEAASSSASGRGAAKVSSMKLIRTPFTVSHHRLAQNRAVRRRAKYMCIRGLGAGVPPFQGRRPSIFAQHRHGARVERKVHAHAQVEPEPAHGQRPERMAVTEADRLIDA